MQKWDFLVVWLSDNEHVDKAALNGAPFPIPGKRAFSKVGVSEFLGYLGNEGWDLAGAPFWSMLIFKRAKS